MPQTLKRAPVFLALLEEAITSTRPRSFPERFTAKRSNDASGAVRSSRAADQAQEKARERALVSRPRSPTRESLVRPTKVISGEGPIAAPRPRAPSPGPAPGQAVVSISREEALETAREVAREQSAIRHYKMSRQLAAEARELSILAIQLASPVALPHNYDDGPFAEDDVRAWPRRA